jgi:hypothetical protein
MGWAGNAAVLTEARNTYNKFTLGNTNCGINELKDRRRFI